MVVVVEVALPDLLWEPEEVVLESEVAETF